MTEDIRLDSHKLIYHPGTVSRWLDGENIYQLRLKYLQVVHATTDVYFVQLIIWDTSLFS